AAGGQRDPLGGGHLLGDDRDEPAGGPDVAQDAPARGERVPGGAEVLAGGVDVALGGGGPGRAQRVGAGVDVAPSEEHGEPGDDGGQRHASAADDGDAPQGPPHPPG